MPLRLFICQRMRTPARALQEREIVGHHPWEVAPKGRVVAPVLCAGGGGVGGHASTPLGEEGVLHTRGDSETKGQKCSLHRGLF